MSFRKLFTLAGQGQMKNQVMNDDQPDHSGNIIPAVAAIFRNEYEYVLEWVSWYIINGFKKIIIVDNESDDGTKELLELLNSVGVIDTWSIDRNNKPQLRAYDQIIEKYSDIADYIAFVDADEFIVSDDGKLVTQHLDRLFSDPNTTAVALNWRIFGTGGHISKPDGLVIENFTLSANDSRKRNHHIKSVYRPEKVKNIFPHRAVLLPGSHYVYCDGNDAIFSTHETIPEMTKNNKSTGVTAQICSGPLRVNHYVLKSREEFISKKKHRGDAFLGADHVKSDGYFREYDVNDVSSHIDPQLLAACKQQIQKLLKLTDHN